MLTLKIKFPSECVSPSALTSNAIRKLLEKRKSLLVYYVHLTQCIVNFTVSHWWSLKARFYLPLISVHGGENMQGSFSPPNVTHSRVRQNCSPSSHGNTGHSIPISPACMKEPRPQPHHPALSHRMGPSQRGGRNYAAYHKGCCSQCVHMGIQKVCTTSMS